MRVISGKFKNRKLMAPKGLNTRPTSEKLREAVFNILQTTIAEAKFLDLFAGSGAMGFEALSRGASHVHFLDKSKEAILSIRSTSRDFDVDNEITLMKGDALSLLQKLEEGFDIIYVDPPYASDFGERILEIIDSGNLLNQGGVLFIEESKEVDLESVPLQFLSFVRRRQFGRSSLFQFEMQ